MSGSGGGGAGSNIFAVFIVLVMVTLACVATSSLGGPGDPAALPELRLVPAGMDSGSLEATAVAARATADAAASARAASTQYALAATADFAARQTEVAARRSMEATAVSEATAVAFEQRVIGWTATADAERATAAATQTARVLELEYAGRAAVATATQEALYYEQRRRALDLESRERMNAIWAVTRWAVPVALFLALALLAYRVVWKRTEYREFRPDLTGKYPAVMRGGTAVNLDLQTKPVLDTRLPAPAPTAEELAVKERQQQVDALRAAATSRAGSSAGRALALPNPGFTLLDAGAAPPAHLLADPDVTSVIDGEWNQE